MEGQRSRKKKRTLYLFRITALLLVLLPTPGRRGITVPYAGLNFCEPLGIELAHLRAQLEFPDHRFHVLLVDDGVEPAIDILERPTGPHTKRNDDIVTQRDISHLLQRHKNTLNSF